MIMQVSVIGSVSPSKEQERIAHELGREIAKAGYTLICGGRAGVMTAACKGAKEAGGLTIGILPSIDGSDANPYVDVQIRTGLGYARNSIVVQSGDVVIAVGGSHGTLNEITYASIFGKPVIVMEGAGGWLQFIGKKLDPSAQEIRGVKTIEEAMNLVKELAET